MERPQTINAQGLITQSQVSAGGQILRTNSSTYNTNGTVASRSNALNHRESYLYTNANFPWLTTSVTGPNGLTTLTEYDNIGRASKQTGADNVVSTTAWYSCAAPHSSYPCSTDIGQDPETYYNLQQTLGQQPTLTFFDRLGRTVRTLRYVYANGSDQLSTQFTRYNAEGFQYDILGRKIQMRDPDQGTWNYQYDVLGQLIKQTDAMGQVTTMNYDVLGRLSTRTDTAQSTQWVYDQGTQGIGKLSSEVIGPVNQAATMGTQYQYDSLGRSLSVTTSIVGGVGAGTYTSSTTYDSFSRPQIQTYPKNGLTLRNEYSTSSGQLLATKEATTGQVLWQLGEQNASGQLVKATLGGKINRQFNYDNNNRLTQIQATAAGTTRQNWQVQYDAAGNVVQRKDALGGYTENLAYDSINRLTNTSGGSVTTNNVSYDALGNILNKQDVGNYIYGQTCNGVKAGPHAVSQTTGGAYSASYCYDRNGNLTSKTQTNGFNQQVVYTPFNKPYQILQSDSSGTQLEYGPSRELVRQTDSKSGAITTTIYLPGYERSQNGSTITEKFYIGDYAMFAKSGTSTALRYLLQDNQGSVTTILDQSGAPTENLAFDVWGKRRNANWSPATTTLTSATTNRGYTGHKMLDNVGLIHMNGRVYDPVIARFVSADPIIQAPGDLQSYNRYAYVRNNPGSLTDPSGYSWLSKKWKKAWHNKYIRAAAAIAISVYMPAALSSIGWGSAQAAMATGFVSGAVSTGSIKGAIVGAVTGGLLDKIGNNMEATSLFSRKGAEKVLAHGLVGGASSYANGGKFGAGFASMGVTQAASLSGWFESGMFAGKYGNAIGSGLVGGTASVAAGGDFAMGAVQGAMSRFLNDDLHAAQKRAKLAAAALAHEGDTNYAWDARNGRFGPRIWKCNQFVGDMLVEAGISPVMLSNGSPEYMTANGWANRNYDIPGWAIVDNPMPGDVAAIPRSGGSGHVGIYIEDRGYFNSSVMAANKDGVGWSGSHLRNNYFNSWAGANDDTTYRRYVGR